MVDKGRREARRHPAPRPGRDPKREGPRNTPEQRETRPWRQWHSARQPTQTSPLEVSAPKRPQWGRFVYLAIILLIVAAIAKVIFSHVFWYNASGVVAGKSYTVSSAYPATVQQILVQPSDRVHAGQVLAKLKSPQHQRKLASDKEKRAQRQQKAVSLQAKEESLSGKTHALHTRMRREQRRIQALRQLVAQNAASGGDLAQLYAQHAKTHAQLDQAAAQLKGVRTQLSQIDKQKKAADKNSQQHKAKAEKPVLKAPVSGQIAQLATSQGAVLRPGDKAIVIVSNKDRQAFLYFPPSVQGQLHKGQKLTVTGPDGRDIQTRISNIYPSLQSAPIAVKNKRQFESPKVVVAARPINGQQLPAGMHSGTPVNSRLPRWAAPVHWFDSLKEIL